MVWFNSHRSAYTIDPGEDILQHEILDCIVIVIRDLSYIYVNDLRNIRCGRGLF